MCNVKSTCFPLLVFAIGILGVCTASANAEDKSFSFPLSPGSQNLSFQQFDESGGLTLTGVTLELLSGSIQAHVEAENDSNIPGSMGINIFCSLDVNGPNVSTAALISDSVGPVSVSASDGVFRSGLDYHDFGVISGSIASSSNSATNLAPWIGTGTVVVNVQGSGGFSVFGVTDSVTWVEDFGADGIVRVTYEYIPEPATMTLLGLGCMILFRKRKKITRL